MYYFQLFTIILGFLVLTTVSVSAQATSMQEAAPAQVEQQVESADQLVASLNLTPEQAATNADLLAKRNARVEQITADADNSPSRIAMLTREVDAGYLNQLNKVLNPEQQAKVLAFRKRDQRAAGLRQ